MLDPFDRVRLPGDFTREGRIALLGEAAGALLEERLPSRRASLFLAGALGAWLANGGSLERDFFRVTAPRGSHRRPDVIWRELDEALIDDERQAAEEAED